MSRKIVCCVMFLFTFCVSVASADDKSHAELVELQLLASKFVELKKSQRLNGFDVKSKGSFSVYKIKKHMQVEPYLSQSMVNELNSCDSLFLVDATIKNGLQKYFFCKNNDDSFILIKSYKKSHGKWQQIETRNMGR